MKTLLIAINSQFVHANLAVRYLEAACRENSGEIKVLEYSINEPAAGIFSGILREKPDVVAFSCYIWNIEMIVKLAGDLKKAAPKLLILAGGPEVSFDNGGLLLTGNNIDYRIAGEGEEKLQFLLKRISDNTALSVSEIQWLQTYSMTENLETLSSPYSCIPKGFLANRIAYIESSRGCPFRCGYCISSITGGVRYFPMEKVYEGLQRLVDSGSKIIKFVDRTFNVHERRTLEIWNYIRRFSGKDIIFHFEIDPGLVTEDMLSSLAAMPAGLVQMEAGIQSIHPETLKAVERPWKIDSAFENLEKLLSFGNTHIHVDLIAGLPMETMSGFRESFNRVYGLFAHHFQLGFLKFLRGSALRENAALYGYSFRDYPPYEIISNQYLSSEELLHIKDIETCLELFYNSGRFTTTLKWLKKTLENTEQYLDAFRFYELLSGQMQRKGYFGRHMKAAQLYTIMAQFIQENFPNLFEQVLQNLRFDYLRAMKNPALPLLLQQDDDITGRKNRQKMAEGYRDKLESVLPRLGKHSLDAIRRQIYIAEFSLPEETGFPQKAVVAIDFGEVSPITGLCEAYLLEDLS